MRCTSAGGVRINVLSFPDGRYHVYLSAERPDLAGRPFRFVVRSLDLAGRWSAAERSLVTAEVSTAAGEGLPLVDAEQIEFSVTTDGE